MVRIVQLLAVLALLALLVTQGLPWIKSRIEGFDGSFRGPVDDLGHSEAALCVEEASAAAMTIGDATAGFATGPPNQEAWREESWRLEEAIVAAEGPCRCKEAGCRKASQALEELRELLTYFDLLSRGDGGIANPARQMESIWDLLDEAADQVKAAG